MLGCLFCLVFFLSYVWILELEELVDSKKEFRIEFFIFRDFFLVGRDRNLIKFRLESYMYSCERRIRSINILSS